MQPKYIQKMRKGLNVIGARFCYYTISGFDFIGGGPTKPPPQVTDAQKSPGPVGLMHGTKVMGQKVPFLDILDHV